LRDYFCLKIIAQKVMFVDFQRSVEIDLFVNILLIKNPPF